MTLRLRIMLFTLGILLPAIAVGAWMVASTFARERATFEANLIETTRAMSLVVDREMERRAAIVRVLATSESLQEWDLPAFDRQARAATVGLKGNVALIDQKRQYLNTWLPPGAAAQPTATVNEEFATDEVLLSDLFVGSVSGESMLAFKAPVKIRGRLYNLSLSILPSELQQVLVDQDLPANWVAAILNRQHRIVARQPNFERWLGSLATADLRDHVTSSKDGFFESTTMEGNRSSAFYSTSPRFNTTFVIGVPRSVRARNTYRSVAEVVTGAVILLLMGSVVAALVSRRLSHPIESLQVAAADLESGRVVTLPMTGVPEYDQVGMALVRASERIRASSQALEQRVAAAVAEVEATQAKLVQSQKLEAIGQLTGGIAHDFNNLLQTLSTGLHVLDKMVEEARAKPLIEAGIRAVNRAARLVQQLLSFSRRTPLKRQTIDFRNQLLAMETLLSKALPANLSLHTQIAPDLWKVTTDPTQLEVALLNLIFNARDAMPLGGVITIRASNCAAVAGAAAPLGEDSVVIEVADTGTGISADILARIFDPFFTTKPVGQGTGLGLVQVAAFAHESGGDVKVQSTQGYGTAVVLRLPRSRQVEVVDEPSAEPVALRGVCRLLFVEDDIMVAEVVTSALTGAGFSVVPARTGDEALALLRSGEKFDAVFSDVVMPGSISGVELAETLAREQPSLPVVLASGYSERAGNLPHTVLLAKPYSIAAVVKSLVEALASRG